MAGPLLRSLTAVLVPPHERAGEPSDWDALSEAWGTGFPADYREFLAVYGAGAIDDYLFVATPVDPAEDGGALTVRRRTPAAEPSGRRRAGWPYPLWPERGALLGWGATADAAELYWDTSAADPDAWTVVSRSREGTFTRHGCGMAEFILRMLGPRAERPLESPRLYGAPRSRFLGPVEERLLRKAGTDPWEYLEELYAANEAAEGLPDGGLVLFEPDGTTVAVPDGTPPACPTPRTPTSRPGRGLGGGPGRGLGRGLGRGRLTPERIAALSAPGAPALTVLGPRDTEDGPAVAVSIALGMVGAPDLALSAPLRMQLTVLGPGARAASTTVDPRSAGGAGMPVVPVVRGDAPLVLEVSVPPALLPVGPDGKRRASDTNSGLTFAVRITDPAVGEFRAAHGVPAEPGSEDVLLGAWPSP
ncbi:hypothetical protein [Peterkaempfera sp. SMS 1(5)a]|uniref:hypothetical protein n=1 Tax=Peterkaempfera podocarpi TaxID=3232308 RepID=UPI00366E6379